MSSPPPLPPSQRPRGPASASLPGGNRKPGSLPPPWSPAKPSRSWPFFRVPLGLMSVAVAGTGLFLTLTRGAKVPSASALARTAAVEQAQEQKLQLPTEVPNLSCSEATALVPEQLIELDSVQVTVDPSAVAGRR